MTFTSENMKGNKYHEKWTEADALKLADDLIEWLQVEPEYETTLNGRRVENINLYKVDFLSQRGLSKCKISQLCVRFPSFREKIEEADAIQEARLLKYSAMSKINTSVAIFSLKNCHGYADRQEFDHKNNGASFEPPIIKIERYDAINEKM